MNVMVGEMGVEGRSLKLKMAVKEVLQDLKEIVESAISNEKEDLWVWKGERHGIDIVKSEYAKLNDEVSQQDEYLYKKIWNKNIPLKVAALGWKILNDGLTRLNLKKGVSE
ncbi:hypothetical protein SLE2022_130120 [Rubroshorea leprosula]